MPLPYFRRGWPNATTSSPTTVAPTSLELEGAILAKMAVLRSHFRVALTSAELETQQGREFFQERLGIFAF
jgi:hypothetical protein